jgi:phosphohistidine phosphatase
MDLLFLRHAEAYDLPVSEMVNADADQWRQADLSRPLNERGRVQAQSMCRWLNEHASSDLLVLCSPAIRCQETIESLDREHQICPQLAPHQSFTQLCSLIENHSARTPILLVGHQPALGQAIAHLLGSPSPDFSVRKGSLWWLRQRYRLGKFQTVIYCVQSPDLL